MEEYEVIRIPVSDGTEKEFAIMDTFTVEEKHYMAVSLIAEDEIQEGVYLYRYRDGKTEISLWNRLRNRQSISVYPGHMKFDDGNLIG